MKKIVILGSGNVATLLGGALLEAGYDIVQIWSRNLKHAEVLAASLHARFTDDIDQIDSSADFYILSVSDDAISPLSERMQAIEGIIVHTSGSTSMNVFENKFSKYGVFYPFQTFSKEREVDFKQTPILLEASDPAVSAVLKPIALSISTIVLECNSDQRKVLHLAAAFACNFSNYMYIIAQKLLEESQLDFDLLRPLILETANKVQKFMPENAQTGPAVRKDLVTINRHIEQLEDKPDILAVYQLLSDQIIAKVSKH